MWHQYQQWQNLIFEYRKIVEKRRILAQYGLNTDTTIIIINFNINLNRKWTSEAHNETVNAENDNIKQIIKTKLKMQGW